MPLIVKWVMGIVFGPVVAVLFFGSIANNVFVSGFKFLKSLLIAFFSENVGVDNGFSASTS